MDSFLSLKHPGNCNYKVTILFKFSENPSYVIRNNYPLDNVSYSFLVKIFVRNNNLEKSDIKTYLSIYIIFFSQFLKCYPKT